MKHLHALWLAGLLAAGLASAGNQSYVYDELARLTEANHDGQVTTYAYDAAGNRVSVTAPVLGTVQFSSSTYTVAENAGSVTIPVTRAGSSAGAAQVNYATSDGTATAGVDYTATSGTLNWASGEAGAKSFNVTILDDGAYEGNETFNVTLSSPSGVTLGSLSTAVVTITDNDPNVPGVPTNLRLVPPTGNGGVFSVAWNAPSGSINHYTLEEVKLAPSSSTTTYAVTALFKAFNKGNVYLELRYRVRACASADESQCSVYSGAVFKTVCPSSGCP